MTLATLSDVLQPALHGRYAVGGLVTLGWEDMRAYAEAAQALGAPLILQAGPSCREHTPLPVLGHMFRHLAESVDVPVVAHLDHGYTYEECKIALENGFTSLMYDGSRKPLSQNIWVGCGKSEKWMSCFHGIKLGKIEDNVDAAHQRVCNGL